MTPVISIGVACAVVAGLACTQPTKAGHAVTPRADASPAPTPASAVARPEDPPMNPPIESADRVAPPAIPSISHGGVRYESRWSDEGVLFAVDEGTAKPLWQVEVYKYWIDHQEETDVQETYFKSMALSTDGQTMLIEDERGVRHAVDLTSHAASILTWPVALRLHASKPGRRGWTYQVELAVTNGLARVMKLDGPSVAEGGALANDLFAVTVDGRAVEYHGKMAKRAPPSRFIELKPGDTFRTVVELGESYPVPSGPHRLAVTFRHTNHFSPDGFELRSRPLQFDLPGPP